MWFFLFSIACATVLDREPPVAVPESFSTTGDTPLPDLWWLAFADPVLDQLEQTALRDNFDLLEAWDRLAQAAARAQRDGAGLWPGLDAEVEAGFAASKDRETTGLSLGLAVQYEIDLWGRVRHLRNAAHADWLASREDLAAAAISLSATVAATWYQLVERRGQLELLREQDEVNRRIFDLVSLQFKSGRSKAADVLQQQQLVESNRGDQATVRAQIRTLEHQLAILLGLPPRQFVSQAITSLIELPPLPQTGLPSDLLERRPDVRAALLQVRAADHRLATAIAERFPRLSITARLSASAPTASDLFSNWLLNLGGNLLAPIFHGRRLAAQSDLARAAASQSLHRYGSTILTALGEAEDALAKEHEQWQLVDSLSRQTELSAQVIERTRDNYTKGAETFLRVLDAMLKHQALQRAQRSAQLALIHNRISLCRAIAGGWELEAPNARGTSPADGQLRP